MYAWTQLAPLTQLTELTLEGVIIDLDDDGQVPIPSLPTVRVLRLSAITLRRPDPLGASFCSTFSVMLPSLRELYIPTSSYYVYDTVRADIKSHLGLFVNLRKHNV